MVGCVRVRGKALLTCSDACRQSTCIAEKKGISEVNASSVENVGLVGGGGQVASYGGLFVLGGFADSLGLGDELSAAIGHSGERAPVHDRGRVLTQMALVLAGGGDACSDIEHLRAEPALFGQVASQTTAYRTLTGIDDARLDGVWDAAAAVRARAWAGRVADRERPLVLDIDSTLVEVHSQNKAGAAPHYKGGYGFHPMLCSAGDGEPLWAKLRPANAAANHIADHLEVLDRSIGQLPDVFAAGHRRGDDPAAAAQPMRLRTDAAGCSALIAQGCRDRNIEYFMTARHNTQITAAIAAARTDPDRWQPAVGGPPGASRSLPRPPRTRPGQPELTEAVDLSHWPEGTRLIVRREPLHPGAQRTLFDSPNWRYWGLVTDAAGDPARLDADMRAHAQAEDTIARLKDSRLDKMPFRAWAANAAWTALCVISLALVSWFQALRLSLNPPVWWVCGGGRVREKGLLICDDCDVGSHSRLKNRRHFLCLHHRAVQTGSQRRSIMRAWWPTRA